MTPQDSSRTRVFLGIVAIIAVALLVAIVVKRRAAGDAPNAVAAKTEDSIPAMIQLVIQHMDAHEFPMALATVQQILDIDPKNEYAAGVRPMLEDRVAQRAKAPTTLPRAVDREAALLAKLGKKLPELKFEAVPLDEMLPYLEQVSGVMIHVKWSLIDAAGMDRKTPITARLRDVKLSKALDVLLRAAGDGRVQLGYSIDEGVLTISTADDLATNVLTSVYDVRDLAATAVPGSATQQQLIDEIIRLIQDTVESTSWKANGGKSGTIRELQGQLIITQTKVNQNSIANLLSQLREIRSVQISVEASVLEIADTAIEPFLKPMERQWPGEVTSARSFIAPTTQPANVATSAIGASDNRIGKQFLNDEQLREPLAAATSRITLPRLTLFNGQYGNTETKTASGSTALYVQATASSDRRFVTTTTQLSSETLATTLSIPDGATALIPVYHTSADAGLHKWLLIKPSIIPQRQAEPQQYPISVTTVPSER